MYIFPKQNEIIDSILKGLETAKNNFKFWTADELYLSYAPSKFLTIHVAQEIAKLENAPEIFIDATISDILRCSLPSRSSYSEFMKEKNLPQDVFSLTLDDRFIHKTDNDSVSRVIIAIKNGVRNVQDEYKLEIEKICKMLDREKEEDSTLYYGVFAFYLDISSGARKKAEKRIEEIISSFDEVVKDYPNLKSKFEGGKVNNIPNIGEWSIGCYIIEFK